ncbi:MAG: peptidase MA family metallohydrolase [Polyangiaceae bacterium]
MKRSSVFAAALRKFAQMLSFVCIALFSTTGWAQGSVSAPKSLAPQDAPYILTPSTIRIPAVPEENYASRIVSGFMKVSFPKGTESRIDPVLAEVDGMRARLAKDLGAPPIAQVEVRIARTWEDMAKLAPIGAPPPSYATGVAYSSLHLILITLQEPISFQGTDVESTLVHELAHVALEDATGGHHVPRWFNEGLAVHEAHENSLARNETLMKAAYARNLIPLSELDVRFPDDDSYKISVAYAEAADFVRFLLRDQDKSRFSSVISRVKEGQAFERALIDAYGADIRVLEFQWKQELDDRSSYVPVVATGSVLWFLGAVALFAAYIRRRMKNKKTLTRWEGEELELAKARAAALMLEEEPMPFPPTPVEQAAASLPPRVEHEGRWHTLH